LELVLIVKKALLGSYTLNFSSNIRNKNGFLTIIPNIRLARVERQRGTGDANPTVIVGADMPTSLIKADDAIMKQLLGNYDKVIDVNLTNQINADITVQLKLSKNILFNSTNAAQYAMERRDWARPSELNGNNGNSSYSYATLQQNYTSSNYLTWNPKVGNHHTFSNILGSEMVYSQFQSTTAMGERGSNDQIQTVGGFANGPYLYGGSDYIGTGLLSLYGRTTYEYKDRYIFSVLYRGDAASRFGKNNKWGYFPSASLAWIASDEKFMEKYSSWLSFLKFRASYGTVGNLPGNAYLQYSLYSTGAANYTGAGLQPKGYDGVVSVTPQFNAGGISQDNLTWEKTHSWNLGTDIGLFKDKVYLQIDGYSKESQAILSNVALQSTTGVSSAQVNALGVRNTGVEVNLRLGNILKSSSPIKWEIMANASYNQNMIVSMQNDGRDLVFGNRFNASHILTRGMPINTFYLLTSTGPYSTDNNVPTDRYTGNVLSAQGAYDAYNAGAMFRAGEMGFRDVDGDGRINPFNGGIDPDKLPIGNPNPKVTGGITQNFYWKNFVFSVFGTFTLGRDVLNLYEADLYSRYGSDGQAMARYAMSDLSGVNMWRKPGDVAVYPKLDLGTYRYYNREDQTFYMVKGDYFKVKNISLRYNAGSRLLQKLKVRRAGVYVVADNLFRFQASDKLPDAENVNAYGEYSGGLYPIPTRFTIGFDLGF
jgi:TonB-linked SusC/RagA family outer membrane protein